MGAIFLFHLWSAVPDGVAAAWAGRALAQGFLGVVVFNVVTGLVLAWPHLGPAGRPLPSWAAFVRRRALRIVPAYYLALALWVTVAALLGARSGQSPPGTAGVVSHLLFVHALLPGQFFSIVPAYWWLGLLAEFSVVFVFLLRFQRARGPWRGAALVCAASWGGWLVVDVLASRRPGSTIALVNYMAYYNVPYRLPELAIGVALAGSLGRGPAGRGPVLPPRTFLALLVACAAVIAVTARLPELPPLVHARLVAACVAVVATLLALPAAARIGASGSVGRLAAASYGFYLLHQPLIGYGADVAGPVLGPRGTFWVVLATAAVVAFALSLVLDRLASSAVARMA